MGGGDACRINQGKTKVPRVTRVHFENNAYEGGTCTCFARFPAAASPLAG